MTASAALANDDTQYWQFLILNAAAGKDGRLTFEISPRARADAVGDEQLLTRITYDHRLNDHVTIGGGSAFVGAVGPDEIRPHQQLILTSGMVEARTRVEERFFVGADRMAVRLRQRLQLTVPLARAVRGLISGEVLYNARTQNVGMPTGVDSWRLRTGLQYRLADQLEVTGSYLLLLSPRGVREDQWSHVPQIMLTWRM
ncbi:DUF2490 domain-containing protein [Croceibacterium sp. TMG7-5b_MA50]|uniref:DUF2490 domain-containing protein n=1 Tax=Croceibacterium sp. TMG7-5b_MA50 TaxID=3121290 RepID=UPI003221F0F3